jgi:phosphoribosyl 1,2-cyclic phosphodiesterase
VRLALLGVRGSTPALGPEFTVTGGNTACVALSHAGRGPSLVLDAGTGLRRLSAELGEWPFRGSILLSHLHWDHVQGLPFFGAGDREDAAVRLLMPEQGDPVEVLSRALSPPHFPIGPDGLRGAWHFEGLSPGWHRIEGFDVLALEIDHKGGRTFGFRMEEDGASVAYLPDHALWSRAPGEEPADAANVRELVVGVDVLIHDAQFLEAEREVAMAYGHSTIEAVVRLARSARVGRLVLFHHGPDRTDTELAALAAHLAEAGEPEIEIGTERRVLDLPGRAGLSASAGCQHLGAG